MQNPAFVRLSKTTWHNLAMAIHIYEDSTGTMHAIFPVMDRTLPGSWEPLDIKLKNVTRKELSDFLDSSTVHVEE